jgi:hypothetical protein
MRSTSSTDPYAPARSLAAETRQRTTRSDLDFGFRASIQSRSTNLSPGLSAHRERKILSMVRLANFLAPKFGRSLNSRHCVWPQ